LQAFFQALSKPSNDSITTSQIVSELNRLFKITLAPRTREQLESKIEQIRSRVYKRHKRWCVRRDEFARNLGVPGKLVERWFRAGWIDHNNPAQIKAFLHTQFERDYYFRFIKPKGEDDQISEDPDISITA
jgi:DNA-binding transcriptional regulator YiaG